MENPRSKANKKTEPLITIVTPCLNSSKTIRDTIETVQQAHAELGSFGHSLEHIIIDGDSTDGTADIVRHYVCNTTYTHLLVEPPKGIYSAMNAGLRLAKGTYTHVLNSDDFIIDPWKYAALMNQSSIGNFDVLIGSIAYLSNQEKPSPLRSWISENASGVDKLFKRNLRKGLHYPHPGFIAKTSIYQMNGFDERYTMSADYKLMQQILLCMTNREKVMLRADIIVGMRVGGATSSPRAILNGMRQIRQINQELSITDWILTRYIKKAAGRLRRVGSTGDLRSIEEVLRKRFLP